MPGMPVNQAAPDLTELDLRCCSLRHGVHCKLLANRISCIPLLVFDRVLEGTAERVHTYVERYTDRKFKSRQVLEAMK